MDIFGDKHVQVAQPMKELLYPAIIPPLYMIEIDQADGHLPGMF